VDSNHAAGAGTGFGGEEPSDGSQDLVYGEAGIGLLLDQAEQALVVAQDSIPVGFGASVSGQVALESEIIHAFGDPASLVVKNLEPESQVVEDGRSGNLARLRLRMEKPPDLAPARASYRQGEIQTAFPRWGEQFYFDADTPVDIRRQSQSPR